MGLRRIAANIGKLQGLLGAESKLSVRRPPSGLHLANLLGVDLRVSDRNPTAGAGNSYE